jgi:hypothetical protein
MRLCWADKIPLALFAIITLILLFLGMGQNPDPSEYCRWLKLEHPDWTSRESYCFVKSAQHWSAFLSIEGTLFWKIVAPVWALTRIVDLIMGGPAIRRRAKGNIAIDVPMADIEMPREHWPRSGRDLSR